MLKKDLEQKVKDLKDEIFKKDQKIFELEQFEQIGDERLEKVCQKNDKLLEKINKIKKILK